MAWQFDTGIFSVIDEDSVIQPGMSLTFYTVGTSTPLATYTAPDLATPNTNPVVCDANGRFPAIWMQELSYKIVLKYADGTTVVTRDPVRNPAFGALAEVVDLQADLSASSGSSLVGFIQNLIGAVVRTVLDKLRDTVDVRDFGAIGDGVTDDTAAVQAAITAAALGKKSLRVSAGVYALSAKLTCSSPNKTSIVGDGRGISKFLWVAGAASRGLEIAYTDNNFPPTVTGLSLITAANDASTALLITGPNSASVTKLGPIVNDLEISGQIVATHTWDVGLHFYTAWYISATNFAIKGRDGTTSFDMTAGLKLTSCQVIYGSNFTIFHAETMILEDESGVGNHGEGFCFDNFELVGGLDGINMTADLVAPGVNIGPGHINTNRRGITLKDQYQTSIHDMLIYKTQLSVDDYIGIALDDCNSMRIHDNEIRGIPGTLDTVSTIGIQLSGTTFSDFCSIHDNNFADFIGPSRVGIVLGDGVGKCNVHNNTGDATLQYPVQVNASAEKNNRFHHNFPEPIQDVQVNDATPSVGNDLGGIWTTANTVATSITTFDDGFVGQTISVLVNDANTTFVNSASLRLKNGINYAAPSGCVLVFRFDTTWREVSRSV